jgi:hypothetical protein
VRQDRMAPPACAPITTFPLRGSHAALNPSPIDTLTNGSHPEPDRDSRAFSQNRPKLAERIFRRVSTRAGTFSELPAEPSREPPCARSIHPRRRARMPCSGPAEKCHGIIEGFSGGCFRTITRARGGDENASARQGDSAGAVPGDGRLPRRPPPSTPHRRPSDSAPRTPLLEPIPKPVTVLIRIRMRCLNPEENGSSRSSQTRNWRFWDSL